MAKPKIWSKFTKICNGKEIHLRIEELSKEKFEEGFDILHKFRVPEEPLLKAAKVGLRAEAVAEYKQYISTMFNDPNYNIDVCCLDDGSDRVVGLAIMGLVRRDDPLGDFSFKEMFQTEEMKTLLNLTYFMNDKCNIFDKINLESCYKGKGVVVDKEYRGLGIAGELFKVRVMKCKERGIPLTSALMTSIGSQKAGGRLGWETVFEMEFQELGKALGVQFEDEPVSYKLMAIRV